MFRRPTHDLTQFQTAMAQNLLTTRVAADSAQALGFSVVGVKAVLDSMRPTMFYKTMLSDKRPGQWQDVYHVPSTVGVLYVKFTNEGVKEFKLLSFKKK